LMIQSIPRAREACRGVAQAPPCGCATGALTYPDARNPRNTPLWPASRAAGRRGEPEAKGLGS